MFAEVAQPDAPSTYELGADGFAPPYSNLVNSVSMAAKFTAALGRP
jgi:hypothetical protein